MSWTLLGLLALLNGLVLLLLQQRRTELARMAAGVAERERARAEGSHTARLQFPDIDLVRCIGCGSCVRACPEEGVLDLVHGQAVVVHGARCVGHARCAEQCPTGAIAVTLGDVSSRKDIPVLSDELEVEDRPGLFLAGEVTGYALIRTAVAHGTAVASAVAERLGGDPGPADELDLCIVGAGPAGLACALRAKELGLRSVILEREELGGTVAKYPRRKLVMTQPVDLPLHGRLGRTSYAKEELMELWSEIAARHAIPIRTGEELVGVEPDGDGHVVRTKTGEHRARAVCLALGRRGTPRKLGVPGEELPKVAYSLIDASSYADRRLLVVGGGDSAVEAALALAEQPGSRVTLSYRGKALTRVKARNLARLRDAVGAGRVELLLESEVREIGREAATLAVRRGGAEELVRRDNDEVFVLIGGEPPFPLLERSGVSFDGSRIRRTLPPSDQGVGLRRALAVTLVAILAVLAWVGVFADYYGTGALGRVSSRFHDALRPTGALGLAFGGGAVLLVAVNLAYLVKRSRLGERLPGSLSGWMTSHVVTGLCALLFALVHAGMDPGRTVAGHAFASLGVLVVTGAIGRYFYAFVPRAANGGELALAEVQGRIASLSAEWDAAARGFGEEFRAEVADLVADGQWRSSLVHRVAALLGSERRFRSALGRLTRRARAQGLPETQVRELADLARRAWRTSLMAAHFEDLRGILATWRYLHRWMALLMVLLVALHVVTALRYARFLG